MSSAGHSVDDFASEVNKKTDEIVKDNGRSAESAAATAQAYSELYASIVSSAGFWFSDYSLKIQGYVNKNGELINSVGNII
jgi:malate/lactate dehydrogenase